MIDISAEACRYADGCDAAADTTVNLHPLWPVFACRPCADVYAATTARPVKVKNAR